MNRKTDYLFIGLTKIVILIEKYKIYNEHYFIEYYNVCNKLRLLSLINKYKFINNMLFYYYY